MISLIKLQSRSLGATLLTTALLISPMPASAFPLISELGTYEERALANGYARTGGNSSIFYTETYLDDPMESTIRAVYWDSNRQPIAYKRLDFGVGSNIPENFEVIDYRREMGYRITVKNNIANVKQLKITEDGSETVLKNNNVEIDSSTVIDAGFHRFILADWDNLTRGKTIRIKFLQIDKARLVPLKIKAANCDTPDTTCFKITFDNFLLQGVVPNIFIKYETDSKQLVRYTGIGPITKMNGKSLAVDILYEYQ